MALIICPECGKEISDKASTCIHCGFPLDERNNGQKTGIVQDFIRIEQSVDEGGMSLKASSHVHTNEAPVAKTSFKKKHFIFAALLLAALCFEFTRSILFLVALVCIPISIILIIIKAIAKKPKKIAVILLIASILIVIAYGMTNSHVQAGYNDAYTESTGENSIVGEWTGNSLSIYGDDFTPLESDMMLSLSVRKNGTATRTLNGESKKYTWLYLAEKSEQVNRESNDSEPYHFYNMTQEGLDDEIEAVVFGDYMIMTLNPDGNPVSWGFERK